MKKLVFAAMVVGLLSAPVAQASVTVNDDLTISNWALRDQSFNGGPFHVKIWDDTSTEANSHFGTPDLDQLAYCVQLDQFLVWDKMYNIADTKVKVTESAGGGGTLTRELSGYAMWVYEAFRTLLLTPEYTALPTGLVASDLNDYQEAIWAGVVTDNLPPSTSNIGIAGKSLFTLSSSTQFDSVGTGTYEKDISLKNFTDNIIGTYTNPAAELGTWQYAMTEADAPYKMIVLTGVQDQIFIGTGTAYIPEPASLIVWSLLGMGSWLGLRVWRRRRMPVGRRPWSPENRTAILEIIELGARK